MTLQELQNQPKYVRVLASTYYSDEITGSAPVEQAKAMIGDECEVRAEYYYDSTVGVWTKDKSNHWCFNRSDVQFLTPIEFNGKKIGIGDSVKRDARWYVVYDYTYRDGEWVLLTLKEGGSFKKDCYFTFKSHIVSHRPLIPTYPAKLKWQQKMERLKEEGRKNGWLT